MNDVAVLQGYQRGWKIVHFCISARRRLIIDLNLVQAEDKRVRIGTPIFLEKSANVYIAQGRLGSLHPNILLALLTSKKLSLPTISFLKSVISG